MNYRLSHCKQLFLSETKGQASGLRRTECDMYWKIVLLHQKTLGLKLNARSAGEIRYR